MLNWWNENQPSFYPDSSSSSAWLLYSPAVHSLLKPLQMDLCLHTWLKLLLKSISALTLPHLQRDLTARTLGPHPASQGLHSCWIHLPFSLLSPGFHNTALLQPSSSIITSKSHSLAFPSLQLVSFPRVPSSSFKSIKKNFFIILIVILFIFIFRLCCAAYGILVPHTPCTGSAES